MRTRSDGCSAVELPAERIGTYVVWGAVGSIITSYPGSKRPGNVPDSGFRNVVVQRSVDTRARLEANFRAGRKLGRGTETRTQLELTPPCGTETRTQDGN